MPSQKDDPLMPRPSVGFQVARAALIVFIVVVVIVAGWAILAVRP